LILTIAAGNIRDEIETLQGLNELKSIDISFASLHYRADRGMTQGQHQNSNILLL
jgi:hypothetical protein